MSKKDLWITELVNDCGFNQKQLELIWKQDQKIKELLK